MECSKCGVDAPDGAKYCSACGSELAAAQGLASGENVTAPVTTGGSEQGGWSSLTAHQRRAALMVVAGLLLVVGFLASFGYSNRGWYGPQSLSGSQFADAGEWVWGNEGDPYETGGPLLELSYLLPVAGLALVFFGYRQYRDSGETGGRWIAGVSGAALAVLVVSWVMYFQAFGAHESHPGIGSYLCALGGGIGVWQGRSSWPQTGAQDKS